MDYFTIIDNSAVLISQGGIYKQVPAAYRGDKVYAKVGSGFILLCGFRSTSHPRISWQAIEADGVEVIGNAAPKWGV